MVASELDADDALGGVLASAIFARLDVRLLLLPFPRLYFLPDDFFSPLDSLLLEYDRENGKGGGAGEQKGPRCSTVATVATPVIIVSPPRCKIARRECGTRIFSDGFLWQTWE